MRLVVARCSVVYEGRLDTSLPEATRLLLVKADGSISIHADGGAYKPLNWMNPPNTIRELDDRWVVTNPKGETLTIHLHEVHSDFSHELGEDPGLTKDGVEAHLQVLLAELPESIEPGLTLIRREYPTAVGPVDLLCRDANGQTVESHSISAGLDYPGVGPEHAYLHDIGRAEYRAITDKEAMEAFSILCKTEGIIPAIETAHALAGAIKVGKELGPDGVLLINLSGRGDKDVHTAAGYFGISLD